MTTKHSLSRAMASSTSAASPSWTARERCFGHRAHEVVNGLNLAEVERLERNQTVGHRVVQLAVDACSLLMLAVVRAAGLRDTLVLQGEPSRIRIRFRPKKQFTRSEGSERRPAFTVV
jgi:hypothetical protein